MPKPVPKLAARVDPKEGAIRRKAPAPPAAATPTNASVSTPVAAEEAPKELFKKVVAELVEAHHHAPSA